MKRLLILIISIGLAYSLAAQITAPVAVGNASGRKVLSDKTVTFNIGSPIPYMYKGSSTNKLQVGFPYNVLYMGETFNGSLFVSKGYFPSMIQLQWKISGNINLIERFEVYRKKIGEQDSVWVDNVDAAARKWIDQYCEANEVYEYTLHAIGIPGERRIGYTYVSGIGFRTPLATVTGRIAFEDGTGVENAVVSASTQDAVPATSLSLASSSYLQMDVNGSDDFSSGFTFQAYLKFSSTADAAIFNKASNFSLDYTSGSFVFTVGSETVSMPYTVPTDKFIHISAVYAGDSAYIYIPTKVVNSEGNTVDSLLSAKAKITNSISPNNSKFYFGKNGTTYFNGNIDEVRLWSKELSPEVILLDFNRYISGKESNIYAYIRMNEGFGSNAYDISKTGSTFNERHAQFIGSGVQWSSTIPTIDQLGHKGISDAEGNYLIAGIPFLTDGSSYKFTPMLAPHEFSPAYKILFLSEDANVHNNIDFKDISSVGVSVNVVYNTGTDYPVKDVIVKVDGKYIADENNELVKTKEDGTVSFNVPIGYHYLSFERQGHVFENDHYPARDSNGNIVRKNFTASGTAIKVIDTTRVKLVGRIVGGPVQSSKVLGSTQNPSRNNIGSVSVTLVDETGRNLDTDGTPKSITFTTDPETGEYEVMLLPEKYKPENATAIKNDKYTFNSASDLTLIDMSNQFLNKYITDSIFVKNNLNEMVFDRIDTTVTYNFRKDWTYRSTPTFDVTNASGGAILSDSVFAYTDNGNTQNIVLAKTETDGSITYPFLKPILTFAKSYFVKIKAYEEYNNPALGPDSIDRVPVTDGRILMNNDLALSDKQKELKLNDKGETSYLFTADFPNIAAPYTKNMNITLVTTKTNVQWPTYEAYILGGRPTGNNFVTTGPNQVDFILRDPPGSESSASLEKGFTSFSSTTSSVSNGEEGDFQLAYQMGVKIETSAGTPFFQVHQDFENDNFIGVTMEHSFNKNNEIETSNSVTFSEGYSTSDDPSFVGADGDLFIGHSTNIVYGISKLMEIMPTTDIPSGSDKISESGAYSISIKDGLRVNPEFNTMFVYSQNIIETEMIPHLEYLRNIILEGPYYTKVFTNFDDAKYGANNDSEVWGNSKSTDPYNGPSYVYNPPTPATDADFKIDSVRFYNEQIKGWKAILAINEKQKLNAQPDSKHKNISFGAGGSYTSSIETEYTESNTTTTEFTIAPGLATSVGFSANKFGFRVDMSQKFTHSESDATGSGTTKTQNISYTLSDNDPENYLTVDVLKCQSGNGPVFLTRGGQTSCPYEDERLTKYYQPGLQTLAYATMKIDGPQLTCSNPVSPVVPETAPAYFTLNLSNVSEAGKDNWYVIGVDVASNPDGAKVKMDGATINDGVSVFVPYGKTVVKTLEVHKGRPDVNDYEDIGIYLRSTCEEDIVSEINISAFFESSCTPVEFKQPSNNWVINVANKDTMLVVINGYNLQHVGFSDIFFQYKPTASSNWTTVRIFTNDISKQNEPNTTYINGATEIQYLWDMTSLLDRQYDIRLMSSCTDGSLNYSETLSGILDGQRPQLLGSPQPADGILDISDEISVQFNEPIEKGLLIPGNFKLNGTINNGDISHGAYVKYNGSTDYSVIPEGISFNDKSFTIEFWMRPASYGNEAIFSQGNDPASNLEIGLRSGSKTYFKIGNASFEAPFQFSATVPAEAWQHMAYVFDYEHNDVFIFQNDKIILEERSVNLTYNNSGKIYLAKSASSGSDYFNGSIHELRIWSKDLALGDVYANQYKAMTGNEVGLYGYWPMDEAFGGLAEDKAANRHMELFAPWETYPGGSAWNFSGSNYLEFGTGYFAIIPEMDFTVEFWFKSSLPSDTVCLFSNQKGDGKEGDNLKKKTMSILATSSGKIIVNSMGNRFEAVSNNYFDNSWHHFALTVRRKGNTIAYIDGQAQNEGEGSVLGGIAGGKMHLGVRKWDNLYGTGQDKYYQGKIDEFRIWDLAKTTTQIRLDMNSKLKGDELGLMVYFPFESYYEDAFGVQNQSQTLDNVVSDNNASAAVPVSGNTYTTDAPNMKDVRPVQNIAFTYVASEDKIIITPEQFVLPQLEKNIIEITVKDVEDKYGNMMASPVTWTAYVHRNQVRWEDEQRSFTKELYQKLTFVASIKNTGGQQIGFTLNNLPPWLTASPSSGQINPESSLNITFTVSAALNIGEYNEDIVLHTDNGFDESLPVTVKVYKVPPKWEVNPNQFEYSMNYVGRVKIEGILSTDEFDMVAAFKTGTNELRGFSNVRYIKEFDSYLVFLSVYGNSVGEQLDFRIWDASAGQIIDDVLPHNETFVPNGVKGSISSPVLFEATGFYRQYLPVVDGWNWTSFNKLSWNQNNLNSFFASVSPVVNDQIKTHGGGFSNYDQQFGWNAGTIDSIDNRRMYQIKLSNDDTIVYSGESIVPEDNPISLSVGWNHIGYLPDLIMNVDDALRLYSASESEIIKSQYAFSMFDPNVGWLGTLDVMQPGYGYMVKVTQAGQLKYPNTTLYKSAIVEDPVRLPYGWDCDLSQFEGNMSIVAKIELSGLEGIAINDQMVLGAFIDGECHGAIGPIDANGLDYQPFFLNVSNTSNASPIVFRLYDGASGETFDIVTVAQYYNDAVYGSIAEPLNLVVKNLQTGIGAIGNGGGAKGMNLRCYPNPFNNKLTVEFTGTGDETKIDVVDLNGVVIRTLENKPSKLGVNVATWEGNNSNGVPVPMGIYYVRVVSGETVGVFMISKTM